jgi:hypothetical protein
MTNEELVRRYAAAEIAFDSDTLASLRHPEWTAVWPQSGEMIRGSANERAMMENYPGGPPKVIAQDRMIGSEDRWAMSPLGGLYRVVGEGENWWGEWRMSYPDGRTYLTVILLELRDGKVFRETLYWAEPFEAPEWRAQYVERLGQ